MENALVTKNQRFTTQYITFSIPYHNLHHRKIQVVEETYNYSPLPFNKKNFYPHPTQNEIIMLFQRCCVFNIDMVWYE